MLCSYLRGAAVGAIFVAAGAGRVEAGSGSDGQESRGSGGGEAPVALVYVAVDSNGLGAPPRFTPSPALASGMQASPKEPSQDLVLVPLPAPLWAAASGLTALAMVGLWRRHRLRAEH